MNALNKIILITLTLTSLHATANSGASQNASAASKHSALAVKHGSVATAKLGSAVIATPLIIVGEIGKVSSEVGMALMENSAAPLEITEKTITVTTPTPAEMMKLNQQGAL